MVLADALLLDFPGVQDMQIYCGQFVLELCPMWGCKTILDPLEAKQRWMGGVFRLFRLGSAFLWLNSLENRAVACGKGAGL